MNLHLGRLLVLPVQFVEVALVLQLAPDRRMFIILYIMNIFKFYISYKKNVHAGFVDQDVLGLVLAHLQDMEAAVVVGEAVEPGRILEEMILNQAG